MSEADRSDARVPRPRRALGRGLESLLPGSGVTGLREIGVDRIDPNPNQPRQVFDRKALEDLSASIAEHGIVQPLVVSAAADDRYRLIVGERRLQAARLAGLPLVPAVVKDVSDRQTLELALIENVQRADLDPLEEASAYQRLVQEFGLTQSEVAQKVGRSRVAITNTLRLLALPEDIKQALTDDRITEGHARALLAVSDRRTQSALLARIQRDDLNVRQTEELVRRASTASVEPRAVRDPNLESIEDDLRRALGTRVSLRPTRKGGRIIIEYFSDDEFEGLYQRLVRAP